MDFGLEQERELEGLLRQETQFGSPFRTVEEWLEGGVVTLDEATGQVRRFPGRGGDYEYIYELVGLRREARRGGYPFVVEKSRRMLVTWFFLALYLYDVLTEVNHANFVGSRKLESSAYFLGEYRMLGLYERIPRRLWPDVPVLESRGRYGQGYTQLACPETGSFVMAIASGAHQLRQYTASNVFADEFAFWEEAEGSWSAMKPTTEGGGHIDMCSTPELGSYLYELLYETGESR